MSRKPTRLFIDQWGNRYYAQTIKELREQIPGRCGKMYVDSKTLGTLHVGYVIGRHWLTEYRAVERKA